MPTAPAIEQPPLTPETDFKSYAASWPNTWRAALAALFGPGQVYQGKTITGYRHDPIGGLTVSLGDGPAMLSVPGYALAD